MSKTHNINKLDLECPCCNSSKSKQVALIDKTSIQFQNLLRDRYASYLEEITPDNQNISIKRCLLCGHHWYPWKPTTDKLIKMYENHIRINRKEDNSRKINYIFNELKSLKKCKKGSRNKPILLDYGAGLGNWTKIANELDFETYAYEPSTERSNSIDTNTTLICLLDNMHRKSIDIINLEQVLELINFLKPKVTYLTHISHNLGLHQKIQKELPKNVYLAFDQLQIKF